MLQILTPKRMKEQGRIVPNEEPATENPLILDDMAEANLAGGLEELLEAEHGQPTIAVSSSASLTLLQCLC